LILGFSAPLPQMLQRLLQCCDLSEPGPVLSLGQARLRVAGHLLDAGQLSWVDTQEAASAAGVLMHAWRAVGAVAVAEGDLAKQEVFLELIPLLRRRWPQFPERAKGAAAVIQDNLAPDGTELSPMRIGESRVALAIVAARQGDLEEAATLGLTGIHGTRQSRPSLVMVAGELSSELTARYPNEPLTHAFTEAARTL
jgi:hypothetical protein